MRERARARIEATVEDVDAAKTADNITSVFGASAALEAFDLDTRESPTKQDLLQPRRSSVLMHFSSFPSFVSSFVVFFLACLLFCSGV